MRDHVILYSIHGQALSPRLILVEFLQGIYIGRHSYGIFYIILDVVLIQDCRILALQITKLDTPSNLS